MKDILQDIVEHTHSLGFIPLVKITNDKETIIDGLAEDKTVVLSAKTHTKVDGFTGVFGMPNMDKLNLLLKCSEYKDNAKIEVVTATRNNEEIPVGIHFQNESGDFENDYRFMNSEIVNDKLKTVTFKGAKWSIEFEPSLASIQRLKHQAQVNSEETTFQVKTDAANNLIFSFGDANSHSGSYVFESNVSNKLKQTWSWPISQVMSILNSSGDKVMRISDIGALQITVDSGLAVYNYTLPAMSK